MQIVNEELRAIPTIALISAKFHDSDSYVCELLFFVRGLIALSPILLCKYTHLKLRLSPPRETLDNTPIVSRVKENLLPTPAPPPEQPSPVLLKVETLVQNTVGG